MLEIVLALKILWWTREKTWVLIKFMSYQDDRFEKVIAEQDVEYFNRGSSVC